MQDQVKVSVDSVEDMEFNTDVEDNIDSDNESLIQDETVTTPVMETSPTGTDDSRIISFKQRSNDADNLDFDRLAANPAFQNFIQKLVANEVNQTKGAGNREALPKTPERQPKNGKRGELVKSPLDTTLYAPGLVNLGNKNIHQVQTHNHPLQFNIDNVSKFIEGIRVSQRETSGENSGQHRESENNQQRQRRSKSMEEEELFQEAREKAEKVIIEAEQFRASINVPQGMSVEDNDFFEGDVKNDDEFFHIRCHVEQSLVNKISKGEFVDLDKLLPKQKYQGTVTSEPKTELIFREGRPVIVPHVDKSRSITGVRKWEQAFRVYAVIYSQANPGRAAEIWQYVFTINSVASTYTWENVAEYDYSFRQMMSKNPRRSWSKIYTQMWNLCLT